MKRILLFLLLLSIAAVPRSQLYQQADMELNSMVSDDQSVVYEASTSIKVLPGFYCNPVNENSVLLSVNRYIVVPPDEGMVGGPPMSAREGVVGALPGNLNVSDMGAAVYTIPIMMPSGIGDMTPEIAITYNSQAGNGMLGWGWNISGLSSITRTGQTIYHDGSQSVVDFANDRFLLDGKRLMLCSGSYGGNGSVYKTEIDEMSKIVAYTDGYSGPARFIVKKSDGTTWEYGGTDDSMVEPQNLNNKALMWLVNKISDPSGNSIIFNYLENKNEGESYINYIDYTLNATAGINSMYRVCFNYEERQDEESFFVYGNKVSIKKILTGITIKNMMSGAVLYEYTFTYLEPGNYSSDFKSMYYRLIEIGLSANGMKINPTIISWNKSSHYPDKFLSYSQPQNMFNKVPFVGDFNGDGYSDVITVPYKLSNTYSENVQAFVIINNGDGSFEDDAYYTFSFDRTLEWVYVIDFDGDGLDDVAPFYADYSEGASWKSKISVYLNRGNSFINAGTYSSDRYFTVYPGDYLGDKKVGFFLNFYNEGSATYYPRFVFCENDALTTQSLGIESYSYIPERIFTEDINGDGITEVMYLMESSCVTAKIVKYYNQYVFFHTGQNSYFDSDDFMFSGDFNGDGYTDILKYDNQTYWKVVFSNGVGFQSPVACLNNNLLNGLDLAPVDRYTCSLKDLPMPSVTIRTMDFDGDGKTDVGVFKNTGGNYYLEVGFLMREEANNSYGFGDIRRFYLNINHSHQYIHIGNFLGCENASILGSVRSTPYNTEIPKIVSLNPHFSKYSVERITDGMGNSHGFKYNYLMPSDFYAYEYQWINPDLRTMALPMRALSADTVYTNDVPYISKYSYSNALYHTKGHGLLGFKIGECKLLINNLLKERVIFEKDIETMSGNYLVLPKSCSKYDGNNQMTSFEQYTYDKYSCSQNDKVVMPLLSTRITVFYDFGSILKSNIRNIDYQSDMSGYSYSDIVNVGTCIDGVDGHYIGDDAASCSYWVEMGYTYDNIPSKWIVSRPISITKTQHYNDSDAVGECEIFDYSGANSYQITRRLSLPNANMNYADPLKIVADYSYDAVGHIVTQTLTSPSERSARITSVEYGEEYNNRFPTSKTNENGWEITYSYDGDYGNMLSTTDYNHFATATDSDPFEITKEVVSPDGTKYVSAKRWANGNEHSPDGALYYVWTKTSGNAEKISFFNKNGNVLRDMTRGLNGEAIYVDMQFDAYGNMISKSLPYVAGDAINRYYYVYDNQNRLVEEIWPNGLVKNYNYDGLQKTINTISPNGVSQIVVETYNPMGWRSQTIDIGGNVIDYEYFSDGMLKSTLINGNPSTKVEYEYDGRRKLTKMKDPAKGETSYEYNAYGELKTQKTARGCTTTYSYNNAGDIVRRSEVDGNEGKAVITHWVYDNTKGKLGTLSCVAYGDLHGVTYEYDDLLRVIKSTEKINGETYVTKYAYDAANREEHVGYPSGLKIQKKYSNTGYFRTMLESGSETVLWQTDAVNAMGYITDYQLGNGIVTQRTYDDKTYLLKGIVAKVNKKPIQNLSYRFDGFGNLINRTSKTGGAKSENFTYDNMNRLVGISQNGAITGMMEYDDYGNIISKMMDGIDVFYDARYEGSCPYEVTRVKTALDELDEYNQQISYTPFDKMSRIYKGKRSLSIEYGFDYNRIRSIETYDGKEKEKVYVGDCEFVNDNKDINIYTYLKGPMGVFAVCRTDAEGNNSIFYIHKDNLESWCLITDEDGKIVQRTSYDAWGNPQGELMFDRGFTGHEHLSAFGIINMNGRAYDPMLSMMMSPDDNIQNPDFSQNYNRYAYCYNNPLTYYDPSGEWVEWLMYGVFNGVVNMVLNAESIDTFAEGALSFGAGFVSGALSQGLSECSWALQVAGNVAGTTLKSGVNSFVKRNTGNGLDWSLMKTSAFKSDVMYALGSNLAKSVLNAYLVQPTDSDDGKTIASMLCKDKGNRRILEMATKKITGNLFAGRKIFDGFGITKNNLEDIVPYVECVAAICADNLEFEGGSKTLSNISNKLLQFDMKGVMSKFGSDMNYCYSQFRSLFFKNGG